ncbi:hypothetical protein FHX42_001182 [Saccharopolyspora lacisalsi]|uniref:Uncharacterized protein n=1 Tax=Halosaccharopolyspora lacisalsi TaxID=1000566 RepID=A0A839DS01_9PSEU|nr:hypothetical protein [Halosaccharopolyspora lacisalsi]
MEQLQDGYGWLFLAAAAQVVAERVDQGGPVLRMRRSGWSMRA